MSSKVGEVRSFIGLIEYYRRFVEGFARFASPLTPLLSKDVKFDWTIRNGTDNFVIYSDACNTSIGCVLMQNDKLASYAS